MERKKKKKKRERKNIPRWTGAEEHGALFSRLIWRGRDKSRPGSSSAHPRLSFRCFLLVSPRLVHISPGRIYVWSPPPSPGVVVRWPVSRLLAAAAAVSWIPGTRTIGGHFSLSLSFSFLLLLPSSLLHLLHLSFLLSLSPSLFLPELYVGLRAPSYLRSSTGMRAHTWNT